MPHSSHIGSYSSSKKQSLHISDFQSFPEAQTTKSPGNPSRADEKSEQAAQPWRRNRNKTNKAKNGGSAAAMDTSEGAPAASTTAEAVQPMDTSEGNLLSSTSAALSSINRKIKKGVQIKRSKMKGPESKEQEDKSSICQVFV